MKRVTDVLRDEHRLIQRAAACLDRVVDMAIETDDLCIVSALDLLEFFREFADAAHQEKEELHLFPALLAQRRAKELVLELLEDHKQERNIIEVMWLNLEGAAYGDAQSRDAFVQFASRYSALQLEHAREEDRVLLPLVEEFLDEEAEQKVLDGFRTVDSQLPRRPGYYSFLIERVAARLGSAVASPSTPRVVVEAQSPPLELLP